MWCLLFLQATCEIVSFLAFALTPTLCAALLLPFHIIRPEF